MSPLEQNSIEIADISLEWYENQVQKKKYLKDIYNQMVRSATSIGANVAESKFAQSDSDYKAKMFIALKEANETKYWINRLSKIGSIDEATKTVLLEKIDIVLRILASLCKKQ